MSVACDGNDSPSSICPEFLASLLNLTLVCHPEDEFTPDIARTKVCNIEEHRNPKETYWSFAVSLVEARYVLLFLGNKISCPPLQSE